MERQPQKLEPIKHEKARLASFKTRKNSLMKKAVEFTTLCDVEGCIIVYGPKLRNLLDKPETWASGEGKLVSIIRRYKQTVNTADHAERRTTLSLSKSGKNKTPRATGPRKKNCIGNYTIWDERMDSFTEDQLKMILGVMDNKLRTVDKKLKGIKGDRCVMDKAKPKKLDHADTHEKYDAKPHNLELSINLQTDNDHVCEKVSSFNSNEDSKWWQIC